MNDPMLAVDALDRIIDALKEPQALSDGELSGLYAAARFIKADLDAWLDERDAGGYPSEKLMKAVWHIGAITGFDITNGHGNGQHRSWALGEADTLRRVLADVIKASA